VRPVQVLRGSDDTGPGCTEDDLDRVRTLEKQIARVDAKIDWRVYALYGLTEEEIKIVEGK
jgi:hypothetical protein